MYISPTRCSFMSPDTLATHLKSINRFMFTVRYELVLNAYLDQLSLKRPCHGIGGWSLASCRGCPGSVPGQSERDFCWTVALGQDSVRVLRFVPRLSFHQCSTLSVMYLPVVRGYVRLWCTSDADIGEGAG